MKRSYAATHPSARPLVGAPSPQPPLPPGPPPPPPTAQPQHSIGVYNYAAYTPAQPTAHPQYPGYGYGGPPAAPAVPYTSYSPAAYAPQQPGPMPPAQTWTQPAYPYAPTPSYTQGYLPPPPPPPPPQAQPQHYVQQPQAYPQPYAPAPPQHYSMPPAQNYGPPAVQHSHGPPPVQPAQQQFAPYMSSAGAPSPGPLIGPVQGSPGGAPPFKRTRYDGATPGPPPALPPLTAHMPAGRGGYGAERGGRGGAGNRASTNYGASPVRSHDGHGDHRSGSGTSSVYAESSGSYRGGRSSYESRGGRGGVPVTRGGAYRGAASERGSRGGRGGRPVSALPGREGLQAPTSPAAFRREDKGDTSKPGAYDAVPRGPRATRGGSSVRGGAGSFRDSKLPEKKDRKWTSDRDGYAPNTSTREDAKRTLTDFRIRGLEVTQIEWDWKAEPIKAMVAAIVAQEPVADKDESGESRDKAELADMSFELTGITNEGEEAVPKKLSKKQRKAAKRLAIAEEEQGTDQVESEDIKQESDAEEEKQMVAVDEDDVRAAPVVKPDALAVDLGKKDAKHKRDEEDASLETSDGAAVKKIKPDTDEIVTLGPPALVPLVTPPAVPTGPKILPILPPASAAVLPKGPRAGVDSAPHGRENSRLRIYFASPILAPVPVRVPLVDPNIPTGPRLATVGKESRGGGAVEELAKVVVDEDQQEHGAVEDESDFAAEASVPVDGEEDVDGVELDGEALDGEPVEEVELELESGTGTIAEVDVETEDGTSVVEEEEELVAALLVKRVDTAPAPVDILASPDTSLTTPREVQHSVRSESPPVRELPISDTATGGEDAPLVLLKEPAPVNEMSPTDPSADRISISYAQNTRRIVLDASVVQGVTIYRAEGKIELSVLVQPATVGEGENSAVDELRTCRGILIETLDSELDQYVIIKRDALAAAWSQPIDSTDKEHLLLPPLHRLLAIVPDQGLDVIAGAKFDEMSIVAYLDRSNPLTEARWVKTGDVESWINQLGLGSGIKSGWKGKITVADPDPPPTIQHALETWATTSHIGNVADRSLFVTKHLANNIDNCFEILLRLTRGDRSAPSSYTAPSQAASVGALAATLQAPYAEHQTQVSLAVLAMFRLSVETAVKAGIAKEEVEKQVAEIVRGIPYHLIFKSLDAMYRESKSKKARGAK